MRRAGHAFEHYMRPIILSVPDLSDRQLHKQRVYWTLAINDHHQLVPQVLVFSKKKGLQEYTVPVIFSQHFIERLISYYRVRDMTRLDPGMASVLRGILHWAATTPKEEFIAAEFNPVLDGNEHVVGEIPMATEPGPVKVAKTWIGVEAFNSIKRDWYRKKGHTLADDT